MEQGGGQDLFGLDGVRYKGFPVWCGLRLGQTWTSTPVPLFALEAFLGLLEQGFPIPSMGVTVFCDVK